MNNDQKPPIPQGICIPWGEKVKELPKIVGDELQLKQIWEETESLAYTYIWHCLVSF